MADVRLQIRPPLAHFETGFDGSANRGGVKTRKNTNNTHQPHVGEVFPGFILQQQQQQQSEHLVGDHNERGEEDEEDMYSPNHKNRQQKSLLYRIWLYLKSTWSGVLTGNGKYHCNGWLPWRLLFQSINTWSDRLSVYFQNNHFMNF
jgi:hypothetical protein